MTSTPQYLLLHEVQILRPNVEHLPTSQKCSCFYGFSSRNHCNAFMLNSPLHLVPIPLSKLHLTTELEALGVGLHVIAIDAHGPTDPDVEVATMEVILQAHEQNFTQVNTSYRLTFDQLTSTYRLCEHHHLNPLCPSVRSSAWIMKSDS